jgi:Protein of unknown function (DUF3108)
MPRIAPVLLATLVAASPAAAAQSFTGEYAVSFLGFTVARSTFDSTFGNDTFSVKGRVASAGLAELFDSTRGTISSTGRFDGKTTQPSAFRVDYTEGAKSQTTAIRFRGGAVTKTVNVPPLKKRGNDWVPLQQSHLRSVTDPISATLVRADSLGEVCGRTIRVYDGEMRADLRLEPESENALAVPGFEGKTVTCRVRFVPVAGYRQGRRALEFLKNRSQIRIAFAQLGTTGVYAPVHAKVGTQIGTLTVSARRFETGK